MRLFVDFWSKNRQNWPSLSIRSFGSPFCDLRPNVSQNPPFSALSRPPLRGGVHDFGILAILAPFWTFSYTSMDFLVIFGDFLWNSLWNFCKFFVKKLHFVWREKVLIDVEKKRVVKIMKKTWFLTKSAKKA